MAEANALVEAVKKARYDLRLTQQDVEARGGPSVATQRTVEKGAVGEGVQRPRPKTLRSYDHAFGWSAGTAAALYSGETSGPTSTATSTSVDRFVVDAADAAPRALGEFIGDGVAVVLLDHSHDEYPDPNIHELAHRVLMLARLGGGQ